MASGSAFLTVATLFVILLGVGSIISMGLLTGNSANHSNVITVNGTGEAFSVPDIATFSFTARKESATVKEAQEFVSEQVSKVVTILGSLDIEEKDIKTTSYNSYPRYEWQMEKVSCNEFGCPPGQNKRTLVGYEQSQSVQIKVRDLDSVSDVLQVLGDAGVDSIQGPNFTIDDQDSVLTEARKEAIAKARQKAEELASELGVKLGKVVNFSDSSGGYYPTPMYSNRSLAVEEFAVADAGFAPKIPTGENQVTASVSITYKIK